jgi:plastocyanin
MQTRRIDSGGFRASALLVAVITIGACSSGTTAATASAGPLATVAGPTAEITIGPPSTVPIVTVTPIAGAPDSGVVVKLVIDNVRWSVSTIQAPAGEIWHVEIDNRDGPTEQHNFVVASGPTFPERVYTSATFKTGMWAFDIPALPAGAYLFICTTHPSVMTGTLTLG